MQGAKPVGQRAAAGQEGLAELSAAEWSVPQDADAPAHEGGVHTVAQLRELVDCVRDLAAQLVLVEYHLYERHAVAELHRQLAAQRIVGSS